MISQDAVAMNVPSWSCQSEVAHWILLGPGQHSWKCAKGLQVDACTGDAQMIMGSPTISNPTGKEIVAFAIALSDAARGQQSWKACCYRVAKPESTSNHALRVACIQNLRCISHGVVVNFYSCSKDKGTQGMEMCLIYSAHTCTSLLPGSCSCCRFSSCPARLQTYRHSLAATTVRPDSKGTPYLYTLNLSCRQDLWDDLQPLFKVCLLEHCKGCNKRYPSTVWSGRLNVASSI
eukprot:535799-Pelagomonas_calceolata.AAC.4